MRSRSCLWLCVYAHGRAGYKNADFWESNGPGFSPPALQVVEAEFREALAFAYLLLRLGWPSYGVGQGESNLLAGPSDGWGNTSTYLGSGYW
jgi:hypothetical protein